MDLIENGGEIETSSDEDSEEVKSRSQPSNAMISNHSSEHIEHPKKIENNKDLTGSMAKLKEENTFLFGFIKSITAFQEQNN
jgi:hypothetical protein